VAVAGGGGDGLRLIGRGAAGLVGVATGGLFPIALLLPLEFPALRGEATRPSGLAQSGGWLSGFAFPATPARRACGDGVVSGVARAQPAP